MPNLRDSYRRSGQRFPLTTLEDQRKRECGDCDVCCRILAVESIGKKHSEDCRFLRPEGGCSLYPGHPEQCQTYFCFYSFGILTGGMEMRPDKLGVLFSATDEIGGPMITANEVWPGAAGSPRVQEIFDAVGERMIVLLGRWGETHRECVRKPAGTPEVRMVGSEW